MNLKTFIEFVGKYIKLETFFEGDIDISKIEYINHSNPIGIIYDYDKIIIFDKYDDHKKFGDYEKFIKIGYCLSSLSNEEILKLHLEHNKIITNKLKSIYDYSIDFSGERIIDVAGIDFDNNECKIDKYDFIYGFDEIYVLKDRIKVN